MDGQLRRNKTVQLIHGDCLEKMKHIASVSFGKDSLAMLLKILVATGKEVNVPTIIYLVR
jgi:hypothetical protein